MAIHDYHFISHWRVKSTVEEVALILGDAVDLPRWWPSVYLDVVELKPGGPDGVGKTVQLHTRGLLPYTLKWQFCVTESQPPSTFTLVASGDFDGRGIWTFTQEGPMVAIIYDWKIRADKPLLRYLSFLFKPFFAANHRWAMAMGEESLKRELLRRQTPNSVFDAALSPPLPRQWSALQLLGIVAFPTIILLGLFTWFRRRPR